MDVNALDPSHGVLLRGGNTMAMCFERGQALIKRAFEKLVARLQLSTFQSMSVIEALFEFHFFAGEICLFADQLKAGVQVVAFWHSPDTSLSMS